MSSLPATQTGDYKLIEKRQRRDDWMGIVDEGTHNSFFIEIAYGKITTFTVCVLIV